MTATSSTVSTTTSTTTTTTTTTLPTTTVAPAPKFQAIYVFAADGRPPASVGIEAALATEVEAVLAWYDTEMGGRYPNFALQAGTVNVLTAQLPMTAADVAAVGGYDAAVDAIVPLAGDSYPVVFYDGIVNDGFCGVTSSDGFVFIPMGNCGGKYPQLQGFPFGPTLLIAHELAHALGAVGSCGPTYDDWHEHVSPNDVLYDGPHPYEPPIVLDVGRDDYFGHAKAGCPNIANSPLLTP